MGGSVSAHEDAHRSFAPNCPGDVSGSVSPGAKQSHSPAMLPRRVVLLDAEARTLGRPERGLRIRTSLS
jgi:hypothetical protein